MSILNPLNAMVVVPEKLIGHMKASVAKSFADWPGSVEEREHAVVKVLNGLLSEAMEKTDPAEGRKCFHQRGEAISKVLAANLQKWNFTDINTLDTSTVFDSYMEHTLKNQRLFDSITQHHESLKESEDWTESLDTVPKDNLGEYAQAAADMGRKQWVTHGNKWMEDVTMDYFRRGGARRCYLKDRKVVFFNEHGRVMSKEEFNTIYDTLIPDVMVSADGGKPERIRLLDVGSCYNPFLTCDSRDSLEITALDLYPMDQSVYECDFLNLGIGLPSSEPVIDKCRSDNNLGQSLEAGSFLDENNSELKPASLRVLPAESFDAITMSLVLNYLPSPSMRRRMISQSRRLLRSPGYGGVPHRAGLLVIFEKGSIFSMNGNLGSKSPHTNALIECWKHTLREEGFEFVKYEALTYGRGRNHGLVFRTAPICKKRKREDSDSEQEDQAAVQDEERNADSSVQNENLRQNMWIKQDFNEGGVGDLQKVFGIDSFA
jgi:hypothetical protein